MHVQVDLPSLAVHHMTLFSLPGPSPGRAIVLPPQSALALAGTAASASAKSLTLKFFM